MKTPLRLKQVCQGSLVRTPVPCTSFKQIAVIGKGWKESGGFIGAEDGMNQLTEGPPKRHVVKKHNHGPSHPCHYTQMAVVENV